jgi:hypothetical protein
MDEHEDRMKAGVLEYGPLIVFWGVWIILAIAGMYALELLKKRGWIGLDWVVFLGLGWIYTVVWVVKRTRTGAAGTFPQAAKSLGTACGIAAVLVGLIFPLVGLYPFGTVPPLLAAVVGVLIYGIGGLYEWSVLKVCGILWWFGSLGMVFVSGEWRALGLAPLIVGGLLLPVLVLRRTIRNNGAPVRPSTGP